MADLTFIGRVITAMGTCGKPRNKDWEELGDNLPTSKIFEWGELPQKVQEEIEALFLPEISKNFRGVQILCYEQQKQINMFLLQLYLVE